MGMHPGEGVCIRGKVFIQVGQTPSDTMGYDQRAGVTHPTGMHSCYKCVNMVETK